MTKKRFVKLLMSDGYSRNEAQTIAELLNNAKIPYKKAIKVNREYRSLCYAFANLASIARTAAENFKQIASSFGKEGAYNAEN